jgi:glyoxylase-like metal-dependent hydrolase (beta-lactamase superfamily II)
MLLLRENIRSIIRKYMETFGGNGGINEIDFSHATEIPPLGPSVDLLGDGSLWAILTPGHTHGMFLFL